MPMCWLPLALSLLALCGCATSSPATSPEPAPAGTFHTVRAGESVWDLARRSGLTVEEIVEVNGLRSADEVAAGQLLFLPAGGVVDDDPPERAASDDEPLAPPGQTPFAWPVDGVVLRDFAPAGPSQKGPAPFDGLLIAAPSGSAVRAAADGEVLFVGDQGTDYGLLVVVRHGPVAIGEADDALVTVYGHLADPIVKAGDTVRAGQRIASVGTSGGVESPRLHFQARRGRTAIDPLPLLPP